MTFRYIIFISLFFSLTSFAQRQPKIDSLKKKLSTSKMNIEKFHVLNHLWKESINNSIANAMVYSESMIGLGKVLKIDTIVSFGYERKAVTHSYMNQFDSSGVYFRKALKMYQQTGDFRKIAGVQRNLGQDHNMIANLDSALYYYGKSGINYTQANDSIGIADILNSEAIVYNMKGYHNIAFDKAIEAEKIYAKKNALMDLNQNRIVIASIYGEMKDTIKAISYYKKTTDFFRTQNQKRQLSSSLILLTGLQTPNKSLNAENKLLINEMISLSEELKDLSMIDAANSNLARYHFINEEYAKSESINRKLIKNAEERKNEYSYTYVARDMSKSLVALQKYNEAIPYLEKAISNATKLNLTALSPGLNKLLSQCYELLGNNKKSLEYYKTYEDLNTKIYNTESTSRFSELQTIFETEKKEASLVLQEEEIKTLNANAKVDKLSKTLYGGGAISGVALSGLLFFGFRQRIKKNNIAREKQEEIYKQEITFKQKELASQTLHLVQKNSFLQELKENLENLKSSPEKFKVEFRRIVLLLKKESSGDKDWEVFKSYFSEVHDNFDNKIKVVYKDITEKELRLASFIKMNLSTKEIAAMLNVLPDSVLKSKYRLKKKLELNRETDLYGYLVNL